MMNFAAHLFFQGGEGKRGSASGGGESNLNPRLVEKRVERGKGRGSKNCP